MLYNIKYGVLFFLILLIFICLIFVFFVMYLPFPPFISISDAVFIFILFESVLSTLFLTSFY